ncbi:MAG TPA: hypothetical protein VKA51_15510 [Rubrobacteraceae bacterium]|nr:hypothetical protein [Rubrobacteraceae bacterium]
MSRAEPSIAPRSGTTESSITGLTAAPIDTMTVMLPLILFGGGIVGLIVGAFLKRSRPDVYERIGGGAGAEE